MSSLVLVGDCAYPADWSKQPAEMAAVCGYLGGDTPHVWTDDEIATLRATGRQFWPIWTAPNSKAGTVIDAMTGARDAAGMIAALRARGIPNTVPVFYDVESSTYRASPTGAAAAIAQFKGSLKLAGWRAFAYCTKMYDRDWVAWWTNVRPTSLPPDWVGQQYGGVPGIDYSVFDLDKLGVSGMPLTDDDVNKVAAATTSSVAKFIQAYMPAQFGGTINRVVQILGIDTAEQADIATIKAKLTEAGQPGSSIDVHELARELEGLFGAALSAGAAGPSTASTGP